MFIWLAVGFVVLVLVWIGAITAFDYLEEYDREEEARKRAESQSSRGWPVERVDRLERILRYQERDY